MSILLFPHNQKAYDSLLETRETERRACIIHFTGFFSIVLVLISLLLFALPQISAAALDSNGSARPVPKIIRATALFPSQLLLVDDEAFAGTNIEVAVFYNNLEFVGDRIFQNAIMLTDVYIDRDRKSVV